MTDSQDAMMDQAYVIAQATLLANQRTRRWQGKSAKVLLTGGQKFEEAWARDAGFSLAAVDDPVVVRATLELFLDHQRDDGLLPRRISSMTNLTRNLRAAMRKKGIVPPTVPPHVKPEYRTAGHLLPGKIGEPKDSNPLLISAAAQYILQTNDLAFYNKYKHRLENAIAYQEANTVIGLVRQNVREDWADHTDRSGSVFYTNLLAWKSLKDMAELAERVHDPQHRHYSAHAQYRQDRIQTVFWDDELGHFINFIDNNQRTHKNFSLPENMLAITTGFATPEQAIRITERLERALEEHGYVPIVTPAYEVHITPWMRRHFVAKYNTGTMMIPWIQSLAAQALAQHNPELARTLLAQVAHVITQHDACLEVTENGQPMRMFFTDSEKHFTWTAAMYKQAYDALKVDILPLVAAAR